MTNEAGLWLANFGSEGALRWARSTCPISNGSPFAVSVGDREVAVVTGGTALSFDVHQLPDQDCSLTDLGLRHMESVVGAHFIVSRGLVLATSLGRVLLVADQLPTVLADFGLVNVQASGVVGETVFMHAREQGVTRAYGFDLVDAAECPEPVELLDVLTPRQTMGFDGGFFLVDNSGAIFSMRRIQDCNGMGFYD